MKKSDNVWDDSVSIEVQRFLLYDGREVEAEFWAECGYSFLTYRFFAQGLDGLSLDELVDYLNAQGMRIGNEYRRKMEKLHSIGDEKPFVQINIAIGEQ